MRKSKYRSPGPSESDQRLAAAVILRGINDVERTSGAVTKRERGDALDWFFDPDPREAMGFEFWANVYGADASGLRAKLAERWKVLAKRPR